mmetsp:Transcript_5101/g.15266  ORF Transcript_5101/g.15266 Transcript_5101/m.15266 type:complete len:240 (-) Transcript_5101:179-898(-)
MPGFSTPVSTRPTGTVPMPPILYTSCSGRRSGLSDGRFGGWIASNASSRHTPLYHAPSGWLPGTFSNRLSPVQPDVGILGTLAGLYPTFFKYRSISFEISSYLSFDQFTDLSSILLHATIICFTPSVNASSACSRVCPFCEMPASNSPGGDATTRIARSACDVPVIMFLMKSRCPGASMIVKKYLSVSNFHSAMSIVIPRSRSALSLSSTHAYLNEPLPISAASFSNFSIARLSMPPHL